MNFHFDPVISLLGLYPKEIMPQLSNIYVNKGLHCNILVIDKVWEEAKYQPVIDWLNFDKSTLENIIVADKMMYMLY